MWGLYFLHGVVSIIGGGYLITSKQISQISDR